MSVGHVRPTATITLDGARAALDVALARAEEIGGRFTIAVVDAGGSLIALTRMDGAFTHSGPIAQDKARTVVGFGGASSGELSEAIADEPHVLFGITKREGVAAFGGGVPIVVAGEVVGAIGASGGSAEEDIEVAQAGARAVSP